MDINILLIYLIYFSAFASAISGGFLVARSFFGFRAHINQSMNLDLEIIRVSKSERKDEAEGRKPGEAWKEEIGAMEQLLTALSSIKDTRGMLVRLLYGSPSVSFEIANSAKSEEIVFFMAVPRKFRESIEKQVHSFFPNAVLEKAKEYNIFFPGSVTEASVIKLKNRYTLPVRTYENMEVDPLSAITNSISKLETVSEGAAIQIVLRRSGNAWRTKGRSIAQKMQQGKRLSEVEASVWVKAGRGAGSMVSEMIAPAKKEPGNGFDEPKPVQLTPEEQELIKSIEQKASKTGF